jgi:hypothetical protein
LFGCPAQPRFLPDDPALSLASVVAGTTAAGISNQEHRVAQSAAATPIHRIADFLSAAIDLEALAAQSGHLRHKGKALQRARLIERAEDFCGGPDLNLVPALQCFAGHRLDRLSKRPPSGMKVLGPSYS